MTIHQVFEQCSNLYKAKNSFSAVFVPVAIDIHDDLYEASRTDSTYKARDSTVDVSGNGVLVYQPDHVTTLQLPYFGANQKTIQLHLGAQLAGSFGGKFEISTPDGGYSEQIPVISLDLFRSFLFGASETPDLFVHWTGHSKTLRASPDPKQAPVKVTFPFTDIEGVHGPGTFQTDTQSITLTLGKPYVGLYIMKAKNPLQNARSSPN